MKKKKSNVSDLDVVSLMDDDYDDRKFVVNAISLRTSAMSDEIDVPIICLDDDDKDDGLKTEKTYKLFLDHLRDDNHLGPLFDCHIRYEADCRKSETRQFQIFPSHSKRPKLENENSKKSRVSQQRKKEALAMVRETIQRDNRAAERRKRKADELMAEALSKDVSLVRTKEDIQQDNKIAEQRKRRITESEAVNETLKAVNETSKAAPAELKAVNETSRNSESKVMNEISKAVPVELKAVNGTSKAIPVELKAVNGTSKAVPVELKAVNDTSKAIPLVLKALYETSKAIPVNKTSKAVPVELKALCETSRNSESKAVNKTSNPIPVRLKTVNETSKAVPLELKAVNETSRNSESKAVNETSGTAQITQMNKGVFSGRRKENQVESVGIVDKDYMNYLTWLVDSLKDSTTKPMENLQKHPSDLDPPITDTPKESTIVPEKDVVVEVKVEQDDEYLSDDSDIIVGDSPFLDGEVTPFVASKSMIIDLENESKKGESSCLFKKELMDDLSRPYEEAEFLNLSREVSIHREVTRCRELRKGRESYYKSTELGQSYLERYEDFNEVYKLVDPGRDKVGALMLLRGFFFYLKNLTQEGAFKPWMD